MGRKKGRLDFWIFFTAIIGTSLLIFNKTLNDFLKLNSDLFMSLGIFLLIVSVGISLSKLLR